MANIDRARGFRFAKTLSGAPVSAMVRKYDAADRSADTTGNHGDIYIGDPLTLVTGGVRVANSGESVIGVAVAVGNQDDIEHGAEGYFNASNLEDRFLAFDENGQVGVIPATDNLFEIQTSADLDLTIGSQADMTTAAATAHGSRTTSRSTVELAAASNNDVRVVENVEDPQNDITLTNARHLVMFTDIVNTQ